MSRQPLPPLLQGASHKLFDYHCTECGPLANVLVSQGLSGEVGPLLLPVAQAGVSSACLSASGAASECPGEDRGRQLCDLYAEGTCYQV